MPVNSDSAYTSRRAAIESALRHVDVIGHFPLDNLVDRNGFDLERTLSAIRGATLVLADLSRERPSCYYELGLAQALDKTTVLVAEAGTIIHQAFRRDSTLFYESLVDLEDRLGNALRKGISSTGWTSDPLSGT